MRDMILEGAAIDAAAHVDDVRRGRQVKRAQKSAQTRNASDFEAGLRRDVRNGNRCHVSHVLNQMLGFDMAFTIDL